LFTEPNSSKGVETYFFNAVSFIFLDQASLSLMIPVGRFPLRAILFLCLASLEKTLLFAQLLEQYIPFSLT
jgi:hypothetical protein